MTIFYEEEGNLKLPVECEKIAQEVIEGALDYLQIPYEFQVNLLLTESEEIHEMNRNFRGIDRPTDVLSFPMLEYETPGDFTFLEELEDTDCFDPESGELILGDIVICKQRVLDQAEEYGHSVLREYAFLIVHSILHLSGYDHIEEEDRVVMEAKQKEIMTELNILR